MAVSFPGSDQNIVGQWSALDHSAFEQLPYWLAKGDAKYRAKREVWPRLFKKASWKQAEGEYAKMIMVEDSPIIRQMADPALLKSNALVDTVAYKERTSMARLKRHRFATQEISFIQNFDDFIRDKVAPLRQSMSRAMLFFEEFFYRTHVWHKSPAVYVCGHGLLTGSDVPAPSDDNNFSVDGKTDSWLLNTIIPKLTDGANTSPYLTMSELYAAWNLFSRELGATPYSGEGAEGGPVAALDEKFLLLTQAPVWNAFINDPWLKENRPINMNVITDRFRGDFWGSITTTTEAYGIRMLIDDLTNPTTVTYPAPEKNEDTAGHIDLNRRMPDPDYATNAQIYVSFLLGDTSSYKILQVGGLQGPWNQPLNGTPANWNGKIYPTKNFLVQSLDGNSQPVMEANSWGEWMRLQAEATYAIIGQAHFNVLPIIHYKPIVGLTTAA